MGNYASCTLPGPVRNSFIRATKVIFPSGEIRRLHEPTKAAELMLEAPNYFLVNAKSLRIGRRFAALNADDDLEIGAVYVFFPMKRLNSAATEADVSAIVASATATATADSAARRVARVLPAEGRDDGEEECDERRMSLGDFEDFATLEMQHRASVCRSKKPLLETIVEEPISLR